MTNLPKPSKKPPQNLPKSLPKASQNEDPFQNHEISWNPVLLLAPFGLLFCSFSPLGPIKKNEYFRALPGSAIETILGAFWTNFNDFWSAKTSPEDDRWHIWKTLNFIVGVINFKGPRVSETLKNDSTNTKNVTGMGTWSAFFLVSDSNLLRYVWQRVRNICHLHIKHYLWKGQSSGIYIYSILDEIFYTS